MKNSLILLLFISSTHIFSNSNVATKDDIKILIEQMREEHKIMREETNRRFEETNRRFEDTNKRLDIMQQNTNKRLDIMQQNMDKRFDDTRTMYLFSFGIVAAALGGLFLEIRSKSAKKTSSKDEEEKFLRLLQNADNETKQKLKKELNEILEVS